MFLTKNLVRGQQSLFKSNRMYICLSVPKDLANRWTDIVLRYSVASYVDPGKVYN